MQICIGCNCQSAIMVNPVLAVFSSQKLILKIFSNLIHTLDHKDPTTHRTNIAFKFIRGHCGCKQNGILCITI